MLSGLRAMTFLIASIADTHSTETTTGGASAPKRAAAKAAVSKPVTSKSAATTKKAAAAPKKDAKAKKTAKTEETVAKVKEEPVAKSTTASRKRKAEDEAPAAPVKKVKTMAKGPVINQPPTQRLNVYMFGEGTAGELGLGTAKNAVDVKRPRLNPHLNADKVGVVQIAAGGMHCIALTVDNKILTWGVNDSGALGRSTEWEGGLKDMDAAEDDASDDSDDDNGLNPHEALPGEVDFSQLDLPEGTRWAQVTAGDSASFALTDDGRVYGWGTFRSNEGPFGFIAGIEQAMRPVLIPDLKKITDIKAGANHALALDTEGRVYAWGSGQQNQLGRRVVERTKMEGLKPREFGLPKGPKKGITSIETGGYHSFAISKTGDVYSWGLNNFGETGIMENAGQDDAVILKPQVIKSLQGKQIISIKGGGHHSLAATADGDCLAWGRIDGNQIGISRADINKLDDDSIVRDDKNDPRIVTIPQKVTAVQGNATFVTTNSDHNIVVTTEGKAYSWGFSANYQTGQGTDDDVLVATLIDNTAVRDAKLNGAGTGGQFSFLTAPADSNSSMTNGA
nr:protein pim1 [Quercus suber]